jgi:hypothetical protein
VILETGLRILEPLKPEPGEPDPGPVSEILLDGESQSAVGWPVLIPDLRAGKHTVVLRYGTPPKVEFEGIIDLKQNRLTVVSPAVISGIGPREKFTGGTGFERWVVVRSGPIAGTAEISEKAAWDVGDVQLHFMAPGIRWLDWTVQNTGLQATLPLVLRIYTVPSRERILEYRIGPLPPRSHKTITCFFYSEKKPSAEFKEEDGASISIPGSSPASTVPTAAPPVSEARAAG